MYEVFDHICAHVKLVYCVMTVFNLSYFDVMLHILCQCALRINEIKTHTHTHANAQAQIYIFSDGLNMK